MGAMESQMESNSTAGDDNLSDALSCCKQHIAFDTSPASHSIPAPRGLTHLQSAPWPNAPAQSAPWPNSAHLPILSF